MSDEEVTKEEAVEAIELAINILPYVAAILRQDDALLLDIANCEDRDLIDVSTGFLTLIAIMTEILAELTDTEAEDVYVNLCQYLQERLSDLNEEI